VLPLLLRPSYRVHVYNVQDLLVCCLPYHATPEFARLVALLQLKGSAWEWLAPCQQSGAPPPRDLLVRRCVNDQVRCRRILYSLFITDEVYDQQQCIPTRLAVAGVAAAVARVLQARQSGAPPPRDLLRK
jgi:hypothetical protein